MLEKLYMVIKNLAIMLKNDLFSFRIWKQNFKINFLLFFCW